MKLPKEVEILNYDLEAAYLEIEEYSKIFTKSKERIDLLNKTAPFFFVKLQELYWSSLIMTVSRFTDPEFSSNKQNLSVDILLKYQEGLNPSDRGILTKTIISIKLQAKHIRTLRSKRISHRDLKVALYEKENDDSIQLKEIEEIYDNISTCLNLFNNLYLGTTMPYKGINTYDGSEAIISCLKEAAIYSEVKARRGDLFLDESERSQCRFKEA